MASESWEKYYEENAPPPNIADVQSKISKFCNYHKSMNSKIILVTSGGTTVPLEHNTVRFVDNFSAGTRGSASAEYFLKAGFAVIFLYRSKSLEPFVRHLPTSDLLDSFVINETSKGTKELKVEGELCEKLIPMLSEYQEVVSKNMLLKIQFTTLSSYLHFLHQVAVSLQPLGNRAILYLAAAVSDFYIPQQDMATHKIHSDSAISVDFHLVPKMLQPLVQYWVPEAFVVSFKLETDESILVQKAKTALKKYGHTLVIGNELNSRKHRVIFVTVNDEKEVKLTQSDIQQGKEIEKLIIEELTVLKHCNYQCSNGPTFLLTGLVVFTEDNKKCGSLAYRISTTYKPIVKVR